MVMTSTICSNTTSFMVGLDSSGAARAAFFVAEITPVQIASPNTSKSGALPSDGIGQNGVVTLTRISKAPFHRRARVGVAKPAAVKGNFLLGIPVRAQRSGAGRTIDSDAD